MKISFLSLFLFVMYSGLVFSQDEVYNAVNVLERIDQLNVLNPAQRIHYDKEIKEPLPLQSHTPADSLNLQYREYTRTTSYLRLDPEKVKQVFPEVVTTTTDGYNELDYTSLIPVLLDAIGKQQEEINQLTLRIKLLEEFINK